jgi:hypothetical protein
MIDNIVANTQRYLELRRFTADTQYNQNLRKMQDWQQSRMAETYWVMRQSDAEAALLNFFLTDVYNGVDLEKVGRKLKKTAKIVDTLFSDLSLVDTGIQFNTLTGEIDQQLTIHLFDNMGVSEINETLYLQALREIGDFEQRHKQLDLLALFSEQMHAILLSPSIHTTLKLSKYPAKIGGLGEFYNLVMRGYAAITNLENSALSISRIMQHEQQVYFDIEAGMDKPFKIYSD